VYVPAPDTGPTAIDTDRRRQRFPLSRVALLFALAILVYLPALSIPFIVDDYDQIPLAHQFAAQGWTPLFYNHELRARATYMFLSAGLDRVFGFSPVIFHLASVLINALCVLLVYASGVWLEIGETAAFWAAAFFAIQEGHQEAIVWPAAAGDLLVFLFGMAAWVCWVKWLQGSSWKWYAMAIAAFLPAIASKESVWAFAALMLLPVLFERKLWRRGLTGAAPFLAMAAAYVIWTWSTRVVAAGYHDVRFSLSAPWFRILMESWWKLLFVWGFAAIGILLWTKNRADRRIGIAASIWMIAGLFPFCFLTYMMQVPSRLTYIASAGLAWLVGAAAARLAEQNRNKVLAVFCVVALLVNLEILWVKKMAQFRERAEPSELLKHAGEESDGTVRISCDPLPDFTTTHVLESVGAKAVFEPGFKEDGTCFAVEYRNRRGEVINESRRLGTTRHATFF
jgi:hypothetical protein